MYRVTCATSVWQDSGDAGAEGTELFRDASISDARPPAALPPNSCLVGTDVEQRALRRADAEELEGLPRSAR